MKKETGSQKMTCRRLFDVTEEEKMRGSKWREEMRVKLRTQEKQFFKRFIVHDPEFYEKYTFQKEMIIESGITCSQ